ncbi:Uncharacterised protein [Mycobacteroides abscessus subsp. abscessus]|uniref:Uncharacterized protein n=7 Tax=Mycobacteroides TaxID=670516 RepID=A0AB74FEV8_9MYCO|nr:MULTISPECIES: hypothetical protein [Mycobacteroides]EUA69553.1 hypothetical protein I540_3343 [Mycobacteroides abscessus subsp. bolletii 1513]AKP58914.1 hypothetical protein MAUC22_16080 [Mycobacteroides abscessus UC22]AMU26705.1 hypothetical protein A3N96_16015 [Mycobacteroides abscessus]AMU36387.1 hypothetical protein A3N98_15210 [Mycobacteroides abscessus]AMU41435.1 hypothetical protein A3N99_15805 [Mycobacteroides abscessus]
MRSFRVFNDVKGVPIVWKLGGVRLGPYGQIAILLLGALSVPLSFVSVVLPFVVFGFGFLVVAVYAVTLSRLDESGALSERTQVRLLRRGLKHRYSANFDLPGI